MSGRRGSPAGLRGALQGLISYRRSLAADRDVIDRKLSAIDNLLADMGKSAPRTTSGVPARQRGSANGGYRSGTLKDYIHRVLVSNGGTMSVAEVTSGVRKAGFRTKNKTLAKSIGIALGQMPTVRRIARGRFRAK
jgi:hypothetical protein